MSTAKMNPDVKAKWLEALRSGRYKQGRHVLKTKSGSFCCLGVLCHLAQKEGVVGRFRPSSIGEGYGIPVTDGDHNYVEDAGLPPAVAEWAGLDPESLTVAGYHLADLNDGAGGASRHSFAQIADEIEKHL